MIMPPEFQMGEKKRQRSSSERMSIACCWDRRRAIELLRSVVGDAPVPVSPGSKYVDGTTVRKIGDFLEELSR